MEETKGQEPPEKMRSRTWYIDLRKLQQEAESRLKEEWDNLQVSLEAGHEDAAGKPSTGSGG